MQNIRQICPGVYQYHCLHFSPQELDDLKRIVVTIERDLQINGLRKRQIQNSLVIMNFLGESISAGMAQPRNADAFYNRGIAYAKRDQHQDAIRDFSKAIEIDPEDADSYMNRGIEKVIIGKKDDGCKDIIHAANLGLEVAVAERNRFCGF